MFKKPILFAAGGGSYVLLELLWRGRSHGSMFLAGGSCFLLLGTLRQLTPRLPLLARAVIGAGIITAVEYAVGRVFNADYSVWDYRTLPMNLHGQICLPFSLLWAPLSLVGMALYRHMETRL